MREEGSHAIGQLYHVGGDGLHTDRYSEAFLRIEDPFRISRIEAAGHAGYRSLQYLHPLLWFRSTASVPSRLHASTSTLRLMATTKRSTRTARTRVIPIIARSHADMNLPQTPARTQTVLSCLGSSGESAVHKRKVYGEGSRNTEHH
jgi:hypothetical protein